MSPFLFDRVKRTDCRAGLTAAFPVERPCKYPILFLRKAMQLNDSSGKKQGLIKAISPIKQRTRKPGKSEPEHTDGKLKKAEERRQREAAERLANEMAVIAEIGRVICSTIEIDEVYERFAAEARKLIPFDRITLSLCDTRKNLITVAYVSGTDFSNYKQGSSFTMAGTLIEQVLQKRTGMIIQSEKMDEIAGRIPHFARNFRAGLRSLIGVPLIYKDTMIGVLYFWSSTPNAYAKQDLRLAEKIGDQIAGAIANAQLYSDLKKTEMSLQRAHDELERRVLGRTEELTRTNQELHEEIVNRKHAEEALQRSEEKFRELIEQINDVVYELDTQGIIKYASPSVKRLFGYPLEEAIGRPISDVLDPEELVVAIENIQKVMAGHIAPREYRARTKSGRICWIRVHSSPVWKGDQVLGIRGVMSDITERKQAEEALKETLDQLESRVRERTVELEETNTALRVLINKEDMDQKKLEESLQSNVSQLISPILSKLRVSKSHQERLAHLNILETNLDNIISPFINRLSATYKNLTPKEVQVAELVKQGKRTKEIAELLGVSVGTVDTHRNNLRKKLELNSKNTNLRSHLLTLT